MQAIPSPNTEEVRANTCFDALLWSLSRPGDIRQLPEAGEAIIIDALLDRECAAFSTDPSLNALIERTGAELVDIKQACHIFLGALQSSALLKDVKTGSDYYPDDGATLIIRATLQSGQKLRLTGPGIDGAKEVQVDGLPSDFWHQRAKCLRYPMGFEIFLLDGDKVMGLPRSTQVETL